MSPMSKDDSEEEDDPPSTSLAPLLHHLAATVVYLVVGYTLWVANQDAPTPAVELSDREKRVLHYSSLPEGWVETRLPTTAKGWASLAIVSWMTWNWIRRLIRAKAIVDARARARATALNRLVLAAGAGGDDVVNPCSDPKCLRCVPSAHDAAIARNGERLRALMRDDQTFAAAVSPAVVTLARQTGAETRAKLHARRAGDLQSPTIFRLPNLPAAPIHRRGGYGCGRGGWRRVVGARCACHPLWDAVAGDVAALETAAPAIRVELRSAVFARARRGDDDSFEAFDPAVRRGGEWSAVYLWRNGVRDARNCAAFPVTAGVVDALRHGCFGGGTGTKGTGSTGTGSTGTGSTGTGSTDGATGGGGGGEDDDESVNPGGCAFGSAYLSRLTPGTVIRPHCGPCNARLRVSVGIRVPAPKPDRRNLFRRCLDATARASERVAAAIVGDVVGRTDGVCALTVGDERVAWEQDRAILFDDSFVHSAEYAPPGEVTDASAYEPGELDTPRVVLVVDLWHPKLGPADRRALRALFPPGMGEAIAHEREGRIPFEEQTR